MIMSIKISGLMDVQSVRRIIVGYSIMEEFISTDVSRVKTRIVL